eukprot:gene12207-16284_t
MSGLMFRRTVTRLPFDLQAGLWHFRTDKGIIRGGKHTRSLDPHFPRGATCAPSRLATELELSDFLKSVERRAFKRSVYHVRDEEAALDIVQDSMMKLAQHYGDKPANELPMLFQRILSNCTLDWFRRQKTRRALFSNLSDFDSVDDDGDFDLLENFVSPTDSRESESAEDTTRRAQVFHEIEEQIA